MSMSGFRALTTRLGWLEQTPPEMVSEEYAPRMLRRQPAHRREAVIVLTHWLYGTGGGALFGALPDRIRLTPWAGPMFGTALWLLFETALIPLVGLRLRNPSSVRQHVLLAVDHLLYGAVLSELRRRPQR